ncbi:MAG: CYTH domain-containing protein [Flavobacteriales bacterium]|nr:CYTH domain-containing protein [Flavobacteriales bacterium]
MIEIERKFLVLNEDYKKHATNQFQIAQGYLNTNPNRTVRVRVKGNKGYINVKGIGNESGTTRFEWEKEIDLSEAQALLEMCEETIIDKIRYEVPYGNHLYEVDEFKGQNEGLVVGEIELNSEEESFDKPNWLGTEITGQDKYYNSYLSNTPYKNW